MTEPYRLHEDINELHCSSYYIALGFCENSVSNQIPERRTVPRTQHFAQTLKTLIPRNNVETEKGLQHLNPHFASSRLSEHMAYLKARRSSCPPHPHQVSSFIAIYI